MDIILIFTVLRQINYTTYIKGNNYFCDTDE